MKPNTCPLCSGRLEEGVLRDRGHLNAVEPQEWASGETVQKVYLGFIPVNRPAKRYQVTAMRCTACGYLMEFANPEGPS